MDVKLDLIKENEHDKGTCTVKALREALAQFPDDMTVFSEGCDCYGSVISLSDEHGYYKGHVVLERHENQ